MELSSDLSLLKEPIPFYLHCARGRRVRDVISIVSFDIRSKRSIIGVTGFLNEKRIDPSRRNPAQRKSLDRSLSTPPSRLIVEAKGGREKEEEQNLVPPNDSTTLSPIYIDLAGITLLLVIRNPIDTRCVLVVPSNDREEAVNGYQERLFPRTIC